MTEGQRTYGERVKDLIRIVSDSNFTKDAKIKVEDEYHVAILVIGHFSGNLLGSRALSLTGNKKPLYRAEEVKGEFLSGLQAIDITNLPEERAKEVQEILELAKTGNWDNLDFVTQLHTFCDRFSRQLPIFPEGEQGADSPFPTG